MSVINELEILKGNIKDQRFYLHGIIDYAVKGIYKAEGLRSMARLIQEDEPFSLRIDENKFIRVPIEVNNQLKQELNAIAEELEQE